jgi:hypothetical protein
MFKVIGRFCASLLSPLRRTPRQPTAAPILPSSPLSAASRNVVRGYDTPELFRSDTLIRLRVMEDELAAQRARIERLERRIGR